jgi:hypothetical protein
MGSTNYGKLTNVSIVPYASDQCVAAANGAIYNGGGNFKNTYSFIVVAVNNNIIRISGGALGHKYGRPKKGRCHFGCAMTNVGKHSNMHSTLVY